MGKTFSGHCHECFFVFGGNATFLKFTYLFVLLMDFYNKIKHQLFLLYFKLIKMISGPRNKTTLFIIAYNVICSFFYIAKINFSEIFFLFFIKQKAKFKI